MADQYIHLLTDAVSVSDTDTIIIDDGSSTLKATRALVTANALKTANNLADVPDAPTARTNLGLAIGVNVQAYDPFTLYSDATDTLATGYDVSPFDLGTISAAFTPTIADRAIQYGTLAADVTLNVPDDTGGGGCEIELLNSGARVLTIAAGYTQVTGTFDGTDAVRNSLRITKLNNKTTIEIVNLG